MKDHIKYRILYSATAILTASVLVSTTAGIKAYKTNTSTGQGGLDIMYLPDLTYQTIRPMNLNKKDELSDEEIRLAEQHESALQAMADVAPTDNAEEIIEAPEVTETSTLDETDKLLVEEDNGYLAAQADKEAAAAADAEGLAGEDGAELAMIEEEEESFDYDSLLTYQVYRIQSGDSYSKIAQKFNVTVDTLFSANKAKTEKLDPGSYLKIPSMSGILYTTSSSSETIAAITKKYEVDAEKCSYVNNIDTSKRLSKNQTIFVPDAQLPRMEKLEIQGSLFRNPLRNARYTLTSYFGMRQNPFNPNKRTYHNGIDMACPQGTSIYPTMGGQVTTSGWSNIYGNYVIIQHPNRLKSLYGHMLKRNVSAGDWVDVNTVIGKVGSTGQSTGPHLHFTIYENDKLVDPLVKLRN